MTARAAIYGTPCVSASTAITRLHSICRWNPRGLTHCCSGPAGCASVWSVSGTCFCIGHCGDLDRCGDSRSTVQRVLRERKLPPPSRPARPVMALPVGQKPYHLLRPKWINRVWYIDLLSVQVLWLRSSVAVLLDGFSRRLLCLRVYNRTPRARGMAALVRRMVKEFGRPRFVITDHGTQFRQQFRFAMKKIGIIPVQARVGAPFLNGKTERAFQTFRVWWRLVPTGLTTQSIQRRLNDLGAWYNEHRPHRALHGRAPKAAWEGHVLPTPVLIRARDELQPQIEVRRRSHGDPRLPVPEISVRLAAWLAR